MRVLQLTPGTGTFLCGSCLRDNAVVVALRQRGVDATIAPLYLPFALEDAGEAPKDEVHMGGINVWLQQKMPALAKLPRIVRGALDSPKLLRFVAGHAKMTETKGLGPMTVSMLRGEEGRQKEALAELVRWTSEQEKPDVVVLSNVMLIGLARSLKETLGARIVCTLQGEAPFLDSLEDPWRKRAWSVIAERARDVDRFVAVSAYTKDLMSDRMSVGGERIDVVWNGIDTQDIAPRPERRDPARPAIAYLARICHDKGADTLVDAYLCLRADMPNARLLLAGQVLPEDRALLKRLKRQVEAAGASDGVEFLGPISREDKVALLQRADVFSVPATYGESFGLYLPEAWAAGLPVVQPSHGAFPELVEATGAGALVAPDDAVALARGLAELLADAPRREAMGQRATQAARERFTLERMAEDLERVIRG